MQVAVRIEPPHFSLRKLDLILIVPSATLFPLAADVANAYKGLSRTVGHAWSTATSGAEQWRVVSLIFDSLLGAVDSAAPALLDDARSAAARLFALTRVFAIVECVRKTRSAHLLLGVRIQWYAGYQ